MFKKLHLVVAVLLLIGNSVSAGNEKGGALTYRLPVGVTSTDYIQNTIVFRVKGQYRSQCSNESVNVKELNQVLASLQSPVLFKMFPRHRKPAETFNAQGNRLVDLSLIYELSFNGNPDLIKTINNLLSSNVLEFAEPKFLPKVVAYTPNDPSIGLQAFLTKINAFNAWGVSQGDTNVVIGITDTGTDINHPDLAANIKHNYADPINGVDDDGDGYVDNFTGWDVGENDNFPQVGTCGSCDHGSHVSGCADAVTDNGIGVAGPGFNCKFLPVKIADASGALTKAYEGITYAADAGCQIINCSWGGGGGGVLGQTIIDYATFNQNSLVVVAAGNNNSNLEFFPAAYNNVLCVAATNTNDSKASFSNYGSYIDVCAPGNNIYTAMNDDTYGSMSGTSMASPIVAGCAGIVLSMNPTFTALQIAEQLRITCDNIYSVSGNSGYQNQLGSGRVNLFNAITTTGPSVRAANIVTVDNNDNVFIVNDTLRITADFTNYLSPTSALAVALTSTSPYVTIIDGLTTIGVLGTLATTDNVIDPFTVKINANAPQNTSIQFKLTFTDGSYTAFQIFNTTVNVDYLNITINDVFTTNSSKGRLCYNGTSQSEGLGFDYQTLGTLAYETGLMIGTASGVSDNVRGATGGATDDDFVPTVTIQKNDPPIWSDFDTYGTFNDNNASPRLNTLVNHRSMSWANAPDSKYHIFEYKIKNTGVNTLTNLYAGVMSDWDIQNYNNNKADEDAALRMGYCFSTDTNGLFAAIKVLTSGGFNHYAIDNIAGGSGGLDLSNGYDGTEKYTSLSTARATAGGTGTGNDVIDVVSTGPFTLATNDSVTVAFALIAGDNLLDIQESAQAAQIKYDLLTAIQSNDAPIVTLNAYPNPTSNSSIIPFYLRTISNVNFELFDAMGKLVQSRKLNSLQVGENQMIVEMNTLPTGIYHYRLNTLQGFASGTLQKL